MPVEVLSLESAGCLDPARVGGKAARLAAALQSGLPVLPGVVIPTSVSATLLDSAARDASSRGIHAARLLVMDSTAPDLADVEGQMLLLGVSLIVRSSSPLEEAPAYAGAFASYSGVTASEMATAVRGVWASALTANDTKPRMAVLVQQEVHPSFAGIARVSDDQSVTVVAVRGSSAPLMAGWSRGETAVVDAAGTVTGTAALALVGEVVVRQVADLAIRVQRDLGDTLIEWAATDQGLLLLQAKRAAAAPPSAPTPEPRGVMHPAAAGLARLLHRYAGTLGEALVLPVLLSGIGPESGIETPLPTGAVTRSAAASAWTAAQALPGDLRARVWDDDATGAKGLSSTLGKLRQGDVNEVAAHLASLPAVDARDIDRLLVELDTVARWLQQNGTLDNRDHFWAVAPGDVDDLIAGRLTAQSSSQRRETFRRALLRWEPCVSAAVSGTGMMIRGEPVSAGTGAGLGVAVLGLPREPRLVPRMVLVAPNPIPQLAPLLWGASALVTTGGSAAAHLVEVARSLGIPAVLGCDHERLFSALGDERGRRTLIAVDGDRGRVVIDVHR